MTRLLLFVLALLLSACETQGPQAGETEVRYGKIVRIDSVSLEGDHNLGVGSIIGAIAGGIIGSNIGRGTGRDVAMVAGALGGGVVGNKVQNQYADRRPGQYITVELSNGVTVGITQPANAALRVGDSVRIEGNGPDARVTLR